MKPTLLHAVMVAAFVVSPSQGNAQQSTGARAVPELPPGGSLGLALGIPAVPNLRDVGGYKTADGATVGRGRLPLGHLQPDERRGHQET